MRALLVLLALTPPASAESLVALRTIPARSIILAADMTVVDAEIPGAAADPLLIAGQEARVTVFAGHPIMATDFASPALVERNQIVTLIYMAGPLRIATEGRVLDRAGTGDTVRVMNLESRTTFSGIVTAAGVVHVGQITGKD